MSLKDQSAVVTGGSHGLGLGLVEALVAHGARVTVVARGAEALDSVRARLGVATISADVTDETAAHRILAELRPDILALNAGVTPAMGRLHQLSWTDFTRALGAGRQGRALLASGGAQPAAQAGKPGPRGIERRGRKRIADVGRLWRRQPHARVHGQIRQRRLGEEAPRDPLPGDRASADGPRHRVGDAGASAYAHAMGMKPGEFVARFGAPMRPREFGEKVVSVLDDPKYAEGLAFGLKGDTGVTMLEAAAA
jgi:NAD(P)-dependent dehydrogenase (short-subunit alcohol dehydrogenase family)